MEIAMLLLFQHTDNRFQTWNFHLRQTAILLQRIVALRLTQPCIFTNTNITQQYQYQPSVYKNIRYAAPWGAKAWDTSLKYVSKQDSNSLGLATLDVTTTRIIVHVLFWPASFVRLAIFFLRCGLGPAGVLGGQRTGFLYRAEPAADQTLCQRLNYCSCLLVESHSSYSFQCFTSKWWLHCNYLSYSQPFVCNAWVAVGSHFREVWAKVAVTGWKHIILGWKSNFQMYILKSGLL